MTTNHQGVTANYQQANTNYYQATTNGHPCKSNQKSDVLFLLPAPANYNEHPNFENKNTLPSVKYEESKRLK